MPGQVKLTAHQHKALEAIKAFVHGTGDCFILQGGAGTGKTTLLAALARWLNSEFRRYAFLAPTGRAARILGDKTDTQTATIHGRIYFDKRAREFIRKHLSRKEYARIEPKLDAYVVEGPDGSILTVGYRYKPVRV